MDVSKLLAAVSLSACCLVSAASAQAATTEDRVKALESQVESLKKELAAAKSSGSIPQDRLAEIERKIDLLSRDLEKTRIGEAASDQAPASQYGLGPAASKVYKKAQGVSVGGYGEVIYQNFETTGDDGLASGPSDTADLQRLVLYFGYKWNDRWLFNSEIEYEHATTGEGDEEKGEVSVEFANLEYHLRREINFRGGLVLIPMGLINEMHEPTVFLGARRPDVERLIIPSTWREIGTGVFGEAGPVSYRGYVVTGLNAAGFEGESIREGRQGGSNSLAENWAMTGRVDWSAWRGLTVGASFFVGNSGQGLTDVTGEKIDATTAMFEGHATFQWKGLDARALYARIDIDDVARLNDTLGFVGDESVGDRQAGWYAQVGYDVLTHASGTEMSLTPFMRYEAYDTQQSVPLGFTRNGENDARVKTIGISWKPITQVVVKADYQDIDNRAGTGVDQWNVLVGFIF